MVKFLFILLFLSLTFCNLSESANIYCKYEYWNFSILGKTYHCDVSEDPRITDQQSAEIISIYGAHENSKTNADVNAFYINDKTIAYFPQGLEIVFVNLKAIFILSSNLQEIHQVDLKPFSDLIYLSLKYNKLEVIEEGLFDFNPKIETIFLYESNIIHIDSNVFDNLPELVNLGFSLSCNNLDVEDSRDGVENLIESIKTDCVNSDFMELDKEFNDLETDLNDENFVGLKEKIEAFEKSLNSSEFHKFRPLNYKFEDLKLKYNSNYQEMMSNSSPAPLWSEHRSQGNVDIIDKFEDLKSSQCGMSSFLSDIKYSQGNFENSFTELKNLQNDQRASLTSIAASISNQCSKIGHNHEISTNVITEVTATINNLSFSQNTTTKTLKDIKDTQETIKSSQNILKDSQNTIKQSQDNLHSSMSDMEVILSDLKKTQNEFKDTLIKIKNSQNEMRISLNDISPNKNENLEDKLVKFEEKLGSFDGKLTNMEGHFADFKSENAKKLDKIEKELLNTRHKISVNFDEKVKGIEKRLVKKFEEILEDKLGKILEEKLGSVLDTRSGK